MSLDDVLRDPSISPYRLADLIEHHKERGYIPPRRKWDIIFGPEPASTPADNRWMLM